MSERQPGAWEVGVVDLTLAAKDRRAAMVETALAGIRLLRPPSGGTAVIA